MTHALPIFAAVSILAAPCAALAQDTHAAHAAAATEESHRHADFESGRFHVRIDGPEQPIGDIILIPGLSSSPEVWDDLTDALKGRYRIHRLHVQGFAGAPPEDNAQGRVAAGVAQDLSRYIREQHLDKPVVIGHSMGGTIALMLAARHPDQVGKLMVVDMIPFMGAMFGGPDATAQSVAPVADMIYQSMAGSPREQYLAQAEAAVTGMIATESKRAGPLEDTRNSDQRVSSASFRELITTDLRPELSRITAPTEVLYVKFNDARMTNETTDAIYQASYSTLPNVQLKRIDDSAHFIMLDQPDRFLAEVNAFLE
ncbi:MAG: alpha/beta hydrolase [Brevundimonas sp.]|nr:MAG: alpha/beta hydrolase [Brevundimonas sp.]